MNRRDILKSAVSLAGASAGLGAARADASPIRTRDRQTLFYKDWGSGAPVVFLAAWALPSDMWDYQMVPLSQQGLRCIAYDRRGHGRSSQPGTGYDYDALADDLAAVLGALDLPGVTLVGMSMAGGEI